MRLVIAGLLVLAGCASQQGILHSAETQACQDACNLAKQDCENQAKAHAGAGQQLAVQACDTSAQQCSKKCG
jgi:hypothetical protein